MANLAAGNVLSPSPSLDKSTAIQFYNIVTSYFSFSHGRPTIMKFSCFVVSAALSVICNTNQSWAQTPPGFSPATNKSLEATFAGINAAVGGSVLLSGK